MKKTTKYKIIMKQKILLFLTFCLFCGMNVSAQTIVTIGNLKYSLHGTEAYVTGYVEGVTDVVIPATIESEGLTFKVTQVYDYVFRGCQSITSVRSEGDNLKAVYAYAFNGCTSLSSVSLPSVIFIDGYAFNGCTSLSSVSLPSVTTIYDYAFSGCTSLSSVSLPSVEKIFVGAFESCTNLQNVWLGYSLNEMRNGTDIGAFSKCNKLPYIVIPASCTTVGSYTFVGCDRLQAIIYLGTQTASGASMAKVYNINNMATWAQNTFSYSGKSQSVTFTPTLPMNFQPVNGTTISDLEQNAGSYSTTIPITFANKEQEFTAKIPYNYTITPGTLKAHVKDASKVYGDANPQFQTEYTGFVTGEDESVITSKGIYSTSATASSAVGTYDVTQSSATAQNYTFQYENGTLTITKAPLTMTPRNKTMTYGDRLPTFDVEYVGLKNSETKPSWTTEPTVTTTATSTSNAGTYPITIANGVAKNYNVTFKQGTLTINKAALTATTLDATREYGDENPNFTFSFSGLKNGEEAPEWGVSPSFASPATKTSPVGTYDITATGGEARNYLVQFVNTGKLTVCKAPLTAKARNCTKKQGQENPIFAIDYFGFKNDETKLALTQEPLATTSATRTSRPGTYEIILSGGIAMNYAFNYESGTLTILPNETPGDQTDNVLTISNIKGNKNTQVVLPIALTNKHQITGLQFDLYIPDGVTVATKTNGKMKIETTSRMDGNYSISSNTMDGFVRVLGYSADGDAFTGSEGDILNITLDISNTIADGDYTIRIADIVLSDVNSTEFHPNDAGAILTVKSYTLGDVDNSGAININDVVCIINYILNKTTGTFIEDAADVDGNGSININDVVTLINRYILHRTSARSQMPKAQPTEAADIISSNYVHLADIDIKPGETKTIEMLMTNTNTVAGIQGNIKLPEGLSFVMKSNGRVDAANVNSRAEDFTLSCAVQDDGSLTFAQYSADGFTFEGNEGAVFTFKIKADENATDGTYSVNLSDVVLSINGVGYDIPNRTSSLTITGATGIDTIELQDQFDVYSLDGIKVRSKVTTTKNLPSGVYIVNGRKVVIR